MLANFLSLSFCTAAGVLKAKPVTCSIVEVTSLHHKFTYPQRVFLSVLPTFKLIRRGLLACLPATLLILTDPPLFFSGEGAFLPK